MYIGDFDGEDINRMLVVTEAAHGIGRLERRGLVGMASPWSWPMWRTAKIAHKEFGKFKEPGWICVDA
jgi:hypothetical protein